MRILTLTIGFSLLMLMFRVGEVVIYGPEAARSFLVTESIAKEQEEESADETSDHAEASAKEEGDTAAEEEGPPKEMDGPVNADGTPVNATPSREFTQTEIDLLQNLSRRREELDEWGKRLELRENLLKGTQVKIERKIGELKQLREEVQNVLDAYNQHEEEKIKSLVKIYENMKPKDAARIFEEVDMDVLLRVVGEMKERKLAPILAKMNPTRAKEVTIELAEQRRLPDKLEEEN